MADTLPNLQFVCNFPPADTGGGSHLIKRLFEGFPDACLSIVTCSYYPKRAVGWKRPAAYVTFPSLAQTGRFGMHRLKTLLNWLSIPALAVFCVLRARKQRVEVIVSVAQGYFFIAAALAARFSGKPLVLIVHDDWRTIACMNSYFLKFLAREIFRRVLTAAAHVYTICPEMQSMVAETYRVKSSVQYPAGDVWSVPHVRDVCAESSVGRGTINLVYAGNVFGWSFEGLRVLIDCLRKGALDDVLGGACRLKLCSQLDASAVGKLGWDDKRIELTSWLGQSQLRKVLSSADVLFLPLSFDSAFEAIVRYSFPSKFTDYLAADCPIVILAPCYASVAAYSRKYGCAIVVSELSELSLLDGLRTARPSSAERAGLLHNARHALIENHDIVTQRQEFTRSLKRLAEHRRGGPIDTHHCNRQEQKS